MRFILPVLLLTSLILPAYADSGDKWKITNDRRQVIGDVYDPGHGRRLQLRDDRGRIVGYIEKSGKVTDTRRRKLGTIEDVGEILKAE